MRRRDGQILGRMALALACAAAIGVILGLWVRNTHDWPLVLVLAISAGLMTLALPAALPWWRRIDDAARDAHKTAWWWGGSIGLGIGVISVIIIGGGPSSPMVQGGLITFGCGFAAYVVTWVSWWLMRRQARAA